MLQRLLSAWAAIVVAGLFVFSGCEEAVNPILESDRNFSLYGTLDMNADVQYIRVAPIRETLEQESAAPLAAVLTSEDLNTGRKLVWRDSVIFFSNGDIGHVYHAPLRLQPGHTYRIEVKDEGSEVVTSAETTVPELLTPEVFPAALSGGVGGGIANGTQQVIWKNLERQPFRIELWYRFLSADRNPFVDIRMPYDPSNGSDPQNGGWQVSVNLGMDRLVLDTMTNVEEFPLLGLGLQVTVLDAAFVPPGGVFDPEVLVQPGTLSNVANGFGFIGSVGRFSVEWILSEDAKRRLKYQTLQDSRSIAGPSVPPLPATASSDGR